MSRTRACGSCGTSNAATARECKSCGQVFGRHAPDDDHGNDTQCAWTDHGSRCSHEGTISDSTVGGGPWYCRRHNAQRFGRKDPGLSAQPLRDLSGHGIRMAAGESNFSDRARAYLRQQIAQFVSASPTRRSRDWATDVAARWENGEVMPEISIRFSCEALGADYDELRRGRKTIPAYTPLFVHEPEDA